MFVAMPSTTSTYKMNVEPKKESFQHLLFSMSCYHIDEKLIDMLMQTPKDLYS